MTRSNIWVVAIGGNALADPHDPEALGHQEQKAAALASPLVELLAVGVRLVIVHGNGPQVGARLVQSEVAAAHVPALPLHVLVAETQGQMGHQLALAISGEAGRRGLRQPVVCLVTHVVVDPEAGEFSDPDKPVGRTYTRAEAQEMTMAHGWTMREVAEGVFRRVVPSPLPLEVVEQVAMERLARDGTCVIGGGGGGVPVARVEGVLAGVDAVVDKDYTAEAIAASLKAARLVVLTDVPGAALSFGKTGERYIARMTCGEAREHLVRGEFAPGSMAPKVDACVRFVAAGGEEAVIASTEEAAAALRGGAGTRIVR